MMKRTIFSVVLVFLVTLPTILFLSCPITTGGRREERVAKAEWAVNKPGKVVVELSDLDVFIEYNIAEDFSNIYSVVCKSYIYTGEKRTYTVNYRILSSVVPGEVLGSCTIGEAEYDSIKGIVFPIEEESMKYELKIPKGLEAISNVNIVIEYNISNLFTKVKIPATVRKPPAGSTSSLETTISYTSSPIVPKSDKIKIDITSRGIIFYLELIDAERCFEGYRRPPSLRIGNEVIINAVVAGRKIDEVSCTPTTINTLPATLRCSIDLTKNDEIYRLFASETGTYIEIDIVLRYVCSMRNTYNIQVIRQV
ncbi:MAG: hypothetical protein QXX30_04725 [Candidatus Aenigmatarchaeota archaeon]